MPSQLPANWRPCQVLYGRSHADTSDDLLERLINEALQEQAAISAEIERRKQEYQSEEISQLTEAIDLKLGEDLRRLLQIEFFYRSAPEGRFVFQGRKFVICFSYGELQLAEDFFEPYAKKISHDAVRLTTSPRLKFLLALASVRRGERLTEVTPF